MEISHWSHQIPCERSFRKPCGLPMFADLRSGSEVISLQEKYLVNMELVKTLYELISLISDFREDPYASSKYLIDSLSIAMNEKFRKNVSHIICKLRCCSEFLLLYARHVFYKNLLWLIL